MWDRKVAISKFFNENTHLVVVRGGAEGSRTPDLLIANEALYQLSYGPHAAR